MPGKRKHKDWQPELPSVRAASDWFRRRGHHIRAPKNPNLQSAFWADSTLVIVQVNPKHFPDPLGHEERVAVEAESRRGGCLTHVIVVWIQEMDGLAPQFMKVKTLPNHISHASQSY